MNQVADATVQSGDCHPGADAAARGAMGTIDSSIPVAYQTAVNSSEAVRQSDE
jgi:hypothetical protein